MGLVVSSCRYVPRAGCAPLPLILCRRDGERGPYQSCRTNRGKQRGYPLLNTPFASPQPVIGLGAELKATVCRLSGSEADLSEPFDDLRDASVYRRYRQRLSQAIRSAGQPPPVIAHDLHPAYLTTGLARDLELSTIGVQHHHAHAVSCAAAAGWDRAMLAVVCDGTGYGTDGASWGGELLFCDDGAFEREAHLRYCPLPGGDAAAIETWRPGISLLREAFGEAWRELDLPLLREVNGDRLAVAAHMLSRNVNCPRSSSLGRLFDGVAAIMGLRLANTFPAEAAIALQQAAESNLSRVVEPYDYLLDASGLPANIDLAPMIRQIAQDVINGGDFGRIAARFHETVCVAMTAAVVDAASRRHADVVALSGGCFLNGILQSRLDALLRQEGLRPLSASAVGPGDEGVSLGQAVVAAQRLRSMSPCV